MAKKPTMKAAAKAAPSSQKEIRGGYVRKLGPNTKLGKGAR